MSEYRHTTTGEAMESIMIAATASIIGLLVAVLMKM